MSSGITRATVLQVWFGVVALVIAAALAFDAQLTVATSGLLLTLSLVPPLILVLLWPKPETLTAGDVMRGTDRRT